MKLPVLVEPAPGAGYVAKVGPPFNWTAQGTTAEEAVANLQREADRHLANGAKVAAIEVPEGGHPFGPVVGSLKGHPLLDEWRRAMAEARANDPDGAGP